MDLDSLYEDLALWEHDLSFPEGPWNLKLIGNQDGGGGLLAEGESFWTSEDFPLKETLNENWGLLEIDDKSSRDGDPFAKWLDARVDLSEFDEFINSPEFEEVMCDLDKSAIEILEKMEPSSNGSLQNEKSLSTSLILHEDVNSISVANAASESKSGSPAFSLDALNSKNVVFVTIEPIDIEDSPSSLASLSDEDLSNAEQPSSPSLPKFQEEKMVLQQKLIVEEPDLEILVEVPVDPDEIMNSSNSESPNALSCRSRQSVRAAKLKTTMHKSRRTPYSCVSPMKDSRSWEDDSLSSSSWDEQSCTRRGNRKERKRDQNRTAASRYRSKKRAEQGALDDEEAALTARNNELTQKAEQLSSEIGYLKGLMREMLISKGLIKK